MSTQKINNRKNISKKIRFEIFKRDKFTCQFCGNSAPNSILEIDHLKPVFKGGDNSILNLITSCYECNRGKSARVLSDDSILKKQLNQLEILEEKRQQLQLLQKWKDDLAKVDSQYIKFYEDLFKKLSKLPYVLNDLGKSDIIKLRKKFSDEEIIDAVETSFRQYYHFPTSEKEKDEQWNKSVNYIGKILGVRKRAKDDPILIELYYCRGILRLKAPYKTDWQILQYLKNLIENGYDIEFIKETCKFAYSWGDFVKYFSQ
jgi:hypothetical protein